MMDKSTVVNSQIFKFLLRTDKLFLTGNKHYIVFPFLHDFFIVI
jgi:hypothetical protein